MTSRFESSLLSRVEDAGLNASAPPQQRWIDGWLVRFCPGKAKRARCVNAVAAGRLGLEERLVAVRAVYAEAALPLVVRITPFTVPAGLDAQLAEAGLAEIDDTRVMVAPSLHDLPSRSLPAGAKLRPMNGEAFAELVGALRESPPKQRAAHAQRLALSPVPYSGYAMELDGEVVACGQYAREGEFVGLYDVFTRPAHRGRGLAGALCASLLKQATAEGAKVGYLQVDGDNAPARKVYTNLGFADGYAYHYRIDESTLK